MRKTLALLLTAVSVLTASAQTNTNTTDQTSVSPASVSAGVPGATSELKLIATDAYNQLKSLSFRDGVSVAPFALIHKKDIGAGLSVFTANTNGLNAGFMVAGVGESSPTTKGRTWTFYDGAIALSYKGTKDIPYIGTVTMEAETGLATDLANPKTVYSQSLVTGSKTFELSNGFYLTVGGGPGYLSKWSEPFYLGFVQVTKRF